ncbi:CAP domain-containing protein [Pseudotabrizicola algicola]|uniref:CAP domain-containing protein n=1 Tax=Pseudotabrizicola algicola TaxID=2709381 RepID=A0A6B3RL28_9RHOB|nr:CAP domain-containing protein [Pseudotabrizicola algicola]NEX46744.1 CAP domain-containing protein [Pseudotabrizicola algicola]
MRIILAAVLLAASLPATGMACSKPSGAAGLERGLVQWINQERQARGLAALRPSDKLAAAAQQHGCDMATRGYFAHRRDGGPSMGDRARANGYAFRKMVENLAHSRNASVDSAAGIWRNSPQHWANILSPEMRDIGVSVTTGGGRIYWVMKAAQAR